ncbi:hypothetical protein [Sporosarcina sp. Marseille-Q4943]|uniref:hypothetical protein n=1 Tax=Sporosarcina sp. Marseille-Q4943 TaxID=2942204 RepID=UPI00208DB990|nr:hypothetical protein [Sporosarcina sp. Marseille-Q4943]
MGWKKLKQRADRLEGDKPIDVHDLKQFNSMIAYMSFSFEWLKTGRQPGIYRGVAEKSVYQKRSYENIDLIPDIVKQIKNDDRKREGYFGIFFGKRESMLFTACRP